MRKDIRSSKSEGRKKSGDRNPKAETNLRWGLVVCFLVAFCGKALAADAAKRYVVLVVWDGMRPDFATAEYAPNLYALARSGVSFSNHHSVYPSATEVNGTAISTGAYPARSGLISNHEYRPGIDPLKETGTEVVKAVRKGDEIANGHYLAVPTIAEIVRGTGRKTAIAGAKGVALLPDRAPRTNMAYGATVFAGSTLPASLEETLTNRLGQFPAEGKTGAEGRTRNDWTTEALLEFLWKDSMPDFSMLWLNEPDSSQHATGPGSPRSLAAIRNADYNLGRVLKTLDRRGIRDSTDVIVVSDHGCSTISEMADLAKDLNTAGFKATREFKQAPQPGQVMVVNNSGSSLLYIIGKDLRVVTKLVEFLKGWSHSGVIFTREGLPGTFKLAQAHLDSASAPDVLISMRWTADKNTNGVPGMLVSEHSGGGVGHGTHVSLSPFDMHNTLVAAGPDFQTGLVINMPSGNVDIAPTVLHLLGITAPSAMDGRVLREGLKGAGKAEAKAWSRRLEAKAELENAKGVWRQYLRVSTVGDVEYCDEGNGEQIPNSKLQAPAKSQ